MTRPHDEALVEAVGVAIAAAHLEFSQVATIPHWANHLARAALSAMEAASEVEWGVRYPAPHPEPEAGYPVPSETHARLLAGDPDGIAIAVHRTVRRGPWIDAEQGAGQ